MTLNNPIYLFNPDEHEKIYLGNWALGLILLVTVASCRKDDDAVDPNPSAPVHAYSAESSQKWNALFLDLERYANGYRPGPAPRALAYLGLAMYEACVPGMPNHNSLAYRYAGLSIPTLAYDDVHWPTVVSTIYQNMLPKFYRIEKIWRTKACCALLCKGLSKR